MSDKKNIDRIFQEGFKNYEVKPPASLWEQIEKELDPKKNRKVIPLWLKFAGIAAGLAILLTSVYVAVENNSTNENQQNQQMVDTQNTSGTENPSTNETIKNQINTTTELHSKDDQNDSNEQLVSEDVSPGGLRLKGSNSTSNSTAIKDPQETYDLPVTDIGNSNAVVNQVTKNESGDDNVENTSVKSGKTPSQIRTLITSPVNQSINQGAVTAAGSSNESITTAEDKKSNNNKLPENSAISKEDAAISAVAKDSLNILEKTLEDYAAQEVNKDSVSEDGFKGRWAASTQVGPIYSNSWNGSAVNADVSNNDRNAGLNLSYGVGVSYEISPRWSVRTGINQVNLAYNTQDVNYQVDLSTASRGATIPQLYSSSAVSDATPIASSPITNDGLGTGFGAQELVSNQFQGFKGEISQQLGYIEVPLEIKYSLVNRKVQVNVLGGMSALFLTDNVVSVQNSNQRLELGEDANFNDFNQSANFGLGLGYDFTNQLGAFIEPTFKYQLSTLKNNTTDFRPYTIGVQSGIIYKF